MSYERVSRTDSGGGPEPEASSSAEEDPQQNEEELRRIRPREEEVAEETTATAFEEEDAWIIEGGDNEMSDRPSLSSQDPSASGASSERRFTRRRQLELMEQAAFGMASRSVGSSLAPNGAAGASGAGGAGLDDEFWTARRDEPARRSIEALQELEAAVTTADGGSLGRSGGGEDSYGGTEASDEYGDDVSFRPVSVDSMGDARRVTGTGRARSGQSFRSRGGASSGQSDRRESFRNFGASIGSAIRTSMRHLRAPMHDSGTSELMAVAGETNLWKDVPTFNKRTEKEIAKDGGRNLAIRRESVTEDYGDASDDKMNHQSGICSLSPEDGGGLGFDAATAAAAVAVEGATVTAKRLAADLDDDDSETLRGRIGFACDRAWSTCTGRGFGWTHGYTRRRCLIALAAAAAAVLVAVMAAVSSSAGEGGDGAPAVVKSDGGEGGGDVTASNPQDLVSAMRYGRMEERIIESAVTDASLLGDGDASPQHRALLWLADEDPMALDPDDPFLLQRYALAVFWFSTYEKARIHDMETPPPNGEVWPNWADKTNWLTGRGICAWHGVSCHHRPGTLLSDVNYDDNNGVTHLNLTSNDVRGALPPELFRALRDMRHLILANNALTGSIPTELGLMTQLESLHLWSNLLDDRLPTSVGSLTNLQDVDLHDNLLDGPLPSELGQLTELNELGLHKNYLTGTIPETFDRFRHVRNLYLDSNALSGTIPQGLFQGLTRAVDVRLSENELNGPIPTAAGDLTGLEYLYLDENDLTGTLPPELGELGHLLELHLGRNRLSGPLPAEWGLHLADLVLLYLQDNALTGWIPPEWGSMDDLRELNMGNNEIGGSIPEELTGMEELRDLRLQDNEIGGRIPAGMGNMFNLHIIYLENNRLEGGVPTELGGLVHLEKMKLHGNFLTGIMPPEVCTLTEDETLTELVADCGGEGGGGGTVDTGYDVGPMFRCGCCTDCWDGTGMTGGMAGNEGGGAVGS